MSNSRHRWGRYAVIGAAIRAERGVNLNAGLATRVSAGHLVGSLAFAAEPAAQAKKRWGDSMVAAGLAGAAVAA